MEKCQKDDVQGTKSQVVEQGEGSQEKHDLHGNANTVNHVRLQPLENATRNLNGS